MAFAQRSGKSEQWDLPKQSTGPAGRKGEHGASGCLGSEESCQLLFWGILHPAVAIWWCKTLLWWERLPMNQCDLHLLLTPFIDTFPSYNLYALICLMEASAVEWMVCSIIHDSQVNQQCLPATLHQESYQSHSLCGLWTTFLFMHLFSKPIQLECRARLYIWVTQARAS